MSPIVSGDAGKARPGGRSFVYDNGKVIRIAQKDDYVYGEQVRAFQSDVLTRQTISSTKFRKVPCSTNPDLAGMQWECTIRTAGGQAAGGSALSMGRTMEYGQ